MLNKEFIFTRIAVCSTTQSWLSVITPEATCKVNIVLWTHSVASGGGGLGPPRSVQGSIGPSLFFLNFTSWAPQTILPPPPFLSPYATERIGKENILQSPVNILMLSLIGVVITDRCGHHWPVWSSLTGVVITDRCGHYWLVWSF